MTNTTMNDAATDNATQVKSLITEGTIYGGVAVVALVFFGYMVAKA